MKDIPIIELEEEYSSDSESYPRSKSSHQKDEKLKRYTIVEDTAKNLIFSLRIGFF